MTTITHHRRTKQAVLVAAAVVAWGLAGGGRFAIPASAANAVPPTWLRALELRSEGMDARYHLGRFAIPASAGNAVPPPWLRALELRSKAMDERYHLHPVAARTPSSGFQWEDAAIGGGFTAGLMLFVAAALVAVVRRTRTRLELR